MTPDYRALCKELVDSVELLLEMRAVDAKPMAITEDRLARARALLAEPEAGEVPRIGHILRLAEIIREVDGRHDKGAAALAEAILSHPGICSAGLAALAQPVAEGPTNEGEVAELVEWLRRICFDVAPCDADAITRAADLLEAQP